MTFSFPFSVLFSCIISATFSIKNDYMAGGIEVITIEAVANLSSHTAKVLYFQRYMQPILIPSVPIHIHFLTF
jgi:hypothetical protein